MIGILPAAGSASRLYGLPKWALPIPGGYLLQNHIQRMHDAYAERVFIGANEHNADLLRQYRDEGTVYIAGRYATMTETVQSAPPDLHADSTLFGMPDTYIEDTQVYQKLRTAMQDRADIAVALFQARPRQHRKGGMCRVDGNWVTEVVDKPESTDLEWIWGALAWQPHYRHYMRAADPHVGYALPRAIADGLDVRAVFCEGGYYDCGTIEGYYEALTAMLNQKVAEQAQ